MPRWPKKQTEGEQAVPPPETEEVSVCDEDPKDGINAALRGLVGKKVLAETVEGGKVRGVLTEIRWREITVGESVRLLPSALVLDGEVGGSSPLSSIHKITAILGGGSTPQEGLS